MLKLINDFQNSTMKNSSIIEYYPTLSTTLTKIIHRYMQVLCIQQLTHLSLKQQK